MKRFLFTGFLFFPLLLAAQEKYSLDVKENGSANVTRKLSYTHDFYSTTDRDKELRKILITLYQQAYLAAHYDSLVGDSLHLTAYVNPGQQHRWAELKPGNVDEGILSEIGYREKLYRNRPLRYRDVARLQEKLLGWCDENGYPFASVRLDSVHIAEDFRMSATLHLEKNLFLKIDSIQIRGKLRISPTFFYSIIGIKPGDVYDETKLKRVSARLREQAFLRESKPFVILFTEKYVRITFFLEKRRASQFNGIIGLLPDEETGKLLLTGDVQLRLQNSFGRGELIDLNWRRLQEQTQDLKAHFNYPFLLRTPFGIDYQIKLYRRDTSFIDVSQTFGVQYLLSGGNSLKAFVTKRGSTLLSTTGLENLTTLPPYADISTLSYGLALHIEHLDYRLNPRRGYAVTLSGDVGNRTIKRNSKLNPVAYENIQLRTVQFGSDAAIDKFWPIGKRSTIKTGILASMIQNPQLFRNELFRIGGLKTLRGFDEESIFASAYSIGTLEYRLLLEENSYLYTFIDGAWYEKKSSDGFLTDTPFGFGAGISFETKAGIFSINYALGKQFDNPIELRAGKVHFGIVGLF